MFNPGSRDACPRTRHGAVLGHLEEWAAQGLEAHEPGLLGATVRAAFLRGTTLLALAVPQVALAAAGKLALGAEEATVGAAVMKLQPVLVGPTERHKWCSL